MTTIRDVARHAGVSTTTVSRHVNGRIRLPAETVKRIEAAVAALDYRPNANARRLAAGRTDTIGLVAPDLARLSFIDFIAAIEDEADRHGYALQMFSTRAERAREIAALNRLRDRHVDGLIMMTSDGADGVLSEMLARQGHVILVCEDCAGSAAPLVTFANADGAAAATRHLIGAGHRAIAHLGGSSGGDSTRQRLAGFRLAMLEAGFQVEEHLVRLGLDSRQAARAAVGDLLANGRPPTALLTANDETTIGAMQALRSAGLRVPEDVSLVGFCGDQVCDLMPPVVTAVRKPIKAMGRRGFQALLALLRGETPEPLIQLPVTLVPGQTVGPPRLRR